MPYIVFDLEATCWEKPHPHTSEIIEIGALRFDEQGGLQDELVQFVRPTLHPVLSPFCRQLTSIRQEDVDEAPLLPEAIQRFQAWIGVGQEPYQLCSWGFYDRKQLQQDCMQHGLDTDWLRPHLSVKHQHADVIQAARPMGLKAALDQEGFTLDGTHHRGIDDARNIAKIFLKYLDRWQWANA